MKTVMDAVKYWNGDKYVCGKHEKHHTHIVKAVGTNRFYSAYASDIGGDSAVCTISEYNQLIHSCSTNSEESSLKHLHIWQEGIKQVNNIDWSKSAESSNYAVVNNKVKDTISFYNDTPTYEYELKFGTSHTMICFGSTKYNTEYYHVVERPQPKQPKPVFTQSMADNGELPQVGMECMIDATGVVYIIALGKDREGDFILTPKDANELWQRMNVKHIKPLDTRTDKEKAVDEAYMNLIIANGDSNFKVALNDIYDKWVGE